MSDTLTVTLSNVPPNENVGNRYSWVDVDAPGNDNLFAQCVYVTNPKEIGVGGSSTVDFTSTNNLISASNILLDTIKTNTLQGLVTSSPVSTYMTNTGDLLGQNGFDFVVGASPVFGSYTSLQVLSACQFTALTATNTTVGTLTNFEIPQGFTLFAPFKGVQLTYGSVIAYK